MENMEQGLRNRYWSLRSAPEGFPDEKNLSLEEEELPSLQEGQLLVKINIFSLDPYMRMAMAPAAYKSSSTYPRKMTGSAVGEVLATRNKAFQVGDLLIDDFGWQEYAITDGQGARRLGQPKFPLSFYLGVLGMPGSTAYHGLLKIANPQPGETLAVSAASGAVGQLVGQIAKLKGCRVVGLAGGPAKCQYAKDMGFDHCIDYLNKAPEDLQAELSGAAPGGYDMYFDNTGGTLTDCLLPLMAMRGRVAVCGQISLYNAGARAPAGEGFPGSWYCLWKQLRMEGFYESRWAEERGVAWGELEGWVAEGKVQVRETVEVGIEKAFKAFLRLFRGSGSQETNVGKLLVKVSENSKGYKVSSVSHSVSHSVIKVFKRKQV